MTTYQIKQMICEQIIDVCNTIIYGIMDDPEGINKYKTDILYLKGRREGLQNLYNTICKAEEEEKYVQQFGIPDQADDSVKSLD